MPSAQLCFVTCLKIVKCSHCTAEFLTAPAVKVVILQEMHTLMIAQYIRKVSDKSENDTVEGLKGLADALSENKNDIFHKIDDTCPAEGTKTKSASAPPRRLGEQNQSPQTHDKEDPLGEKIQAFLSSEKAEDAKRYAAEQGLSEDVDVDRLFEEVLRTFSSEGTHQALKTNVNERVGRAFEEPGTRDFVERTINAEMSKGEQTGKLAARLLEGSVDQDTGRVDRDSLKNTISKLQEMQKNARENPMNGHRKLGELVDQCRAVPAIIKEFMKVSRHRSNKLLCSHCYTLSVKFVFRTRVLYTDKCNRASSLCHHGWG